jgi:hypothetical protein
MLKCKQGNRIYLPTNEILCFTCVQNFIFTYIQDGTRILPKVIKLQENFVFPHEQLLTFEQEDFILGRRNLISPRSSRLSSLCNYLQCCGTKFIWINTSKHKTRFPIIYFKQFVCLPSWRCMRKLLNLLLLEVDFHWTSKAYGQMVYCS